MTITKKTVSLISLAIITCVFVIILLNSSNKYNFPEIQSMLKKHKQVNALLKNAKDLKKIKSAYITLQTSILQDTLKALQAARQYTLQKKEALIKAIYKQTTQTGSTSLRKEMQKHMTRIISDKKSRKIFIDMSKSLNKKTSHLQKSIQKLQIALLKNVTKNKFPNLQKIGPLYTSILESLKKIRTAQEYFKYRDRFLKEALRATQLKLTSLQKGDDLSGEELFIFALALSLTKRQEQQFIQKQSAIIGRLKKLPKVKQDLKKLSEEFIKKSAQSRLSISKLQRSVINKALAN